MNFKFFSLIIIVLVLVLQFLFSIWIEASLKSSIKHEYDKFLVEYKYDIKVREQAARVSEYLALARRLKEDSADSDYERANQLSWELAMWLPSDIYRKMAQAISSPNEKNNELTVVVAIRELLLRDKAGDLTSDDIAHHAPRIGIKSDENKK